jgi:hypothetical protein
LLGCFVFFFTKSARGFTGIESMRRASSASVIGEGSGLGVVAMMERLRRERARVNRGDGRNDRGWLEGA